MKRDLCDAHFFAESVAPLDSKPSCFAAIWSVLGGGGGNVSEQKTKMVAWHHCWVSVGGEWVLIVVFVVEEITQTVGDAEVCPTSW